MTRTTAYRTSTRQSHWTNYSRFLAHYRWSVRALSARLLELLLAHCLLPLESFRAEFMGKQWGLRAEFLNYEKRPFTMQESLAFVLLHDMYVRASGTGEHLELVSAVWKAFDDFGTDRARWLPYWSQTAARPEVEGTYCSAYVRPGKGALLVVSNLTGSPTALRLKLDRAPLGLSGGVVRAWEARSGEAFPVTRDTLRLRLGSMQCALVRLTQ